MVICRKPKRDKGRRDRKRTAITRNRNISTVEARTGYLRDELISSDGGTGGVHVLYDAMDHGSPAGLARKPPRNRGYQYRTTPKQNEVEKRAWLEPCTYLLDGGVNSCGAWT